MIQELKDLLKTLLKLKKKSKIMNTKSVFSKNKFKFSISLMNYRDVTNTLKF